MVKVYGGCIEPEGRDLENSSYEHECESCGGRAYIRDWEAAEGGSLNFYSFTCCKDCALEEGDTGEDY